jgi:hypothetical protein
MSSPNPFNILLDAYNTEAENLFEQYRLGLPEFSATEDEIQLLAQDLKRSAFAMICMQYLHRICEYRTYEDYPEFFMEMGYNEKLEACFYLMGSEGVEWDMSEPSFRNYSPFDAMLEELLYKYRKWWMKEVIDPAEFIEEIFGDNAPSSVDVWSSQSFFEDF